MSPLGATSPATPEEAFHFTVRLPDRGSSVRSSASATLPTASRPARVAGRRPSQPGREDRAPDPRRPRDHRGNDAPAHLGQRITGNHVTMKPRARHPCRDRPALAALKVAAPWSMSGCNALGGYWGSSHRSLLRQRVDVQRRGKGGGWAGAFEQCCWNNWPASVSHGKVSPFG